jgi:MinD-like ATPase involved in chromosome partitioning or flagellar assembly
MAKIVSVHSYRRGTGKSGLVANLAILLAKMGVRVAIVEAAVQSPSLHFPFGLNSLEKFVTLNDYLLGKADITQAVQDVTHNIAASLDGKIFIVPAQVRYDEFGSSPKELFQAERFEEGIQALIQAHDFDVLLIDTQAGVNDDALIPIALSDTLIEIMRLDQQDYQGTAVIVELAQKLGVQRVLLVANFVSHSFDPLDGVNEIEEKYKSEVVAVIPLSEDIQTLPSESIFALQHPSHPLTTLLRQIVQKLV